MCRCLLVGLLLTEITWSGAPVSEPVAAAGHVLFSRAPATLRADSEAISP